MSNMKTRITNGGIKFIDKDDDTEVFSQLTANASGQIEIGSASEVSVTIGAETGLEVKRNATFRNVIMSKKNQNNKAFDIDFQGMLESIINSANFYELRSSLINSLTIYQDLEVLMGQNIRTEGVPSQTISASKTFINEDASGNIIPFYIMSDISTEYPYTTGTIGKKKNAQNIEIKLVKPTDAEKRTLKSRLTQIYNANTDSNIGNILRHTNITDIEDAKLLFPLKYELNLYHNKRNMRIYNNEIYSDPPSSIDSFVRMPSAVRDEKLGQNTYWTINSLDTNNNSSITTILFGKRIKNMLYIFKENNTPLVFTYGTDQDGSNTYYGTALTDFDRIEINYQIPSALPL